MYKKYATMIKLKREELDKLNSQGNLVRPENAEMWSAYNKLLADNNLDAKTHFPMTNTGLHMDDFINDELSVIITAGSLDKYTQ